MTTVNGLFTAGDGVGASGHKFSSGSHAEGRICAKQMVKYCRDNADFKPELAQTARNWLTKSTHRLRLYISSRMLPPLLTSTRTTASLPV